MTPLRRWRPLILLSATLILGFWYFFNIGDGITPVIGPNVIPQGGTDVQHWQARLEDFPVKSLRPLPTGKPARRIPAIQKQPSPKEDSDARRVRLERQAAVKESFTHSWKGYKKHAWLHDEVMPLSGAPRTTFGGWATTLVDSLDSLWIMDMKNEFEGAVKAVDSIHYTTTTDEFINVFETNIRHLGGYLAAHELSEGKYPTLVKKAVEVGNLLMGAFDTPNRMPITRWDWRYYMGGNEQGGKKQDGNKQEAKDCLMVAELGTLSLEFTKLSQLTGDMRYYDAVQRISDVLEQNQNATRLDGLWPINVNAKTPSFDSDNAFTMGAMADSLYEYLPKQYLMLGGLLDQSRKMYEKSIEAAKRHLFRRVLNPGNVPIVISGEARVKTTERGNEVTTVARSEHLTCFIGGMVGLASRVFDRPDDLDLAVQLTEGCVWAYNSTKSGIMPEIFRVAACGTIDDSQVGDKCKWSETKWRTAVRDLFKGPSSNIQPEGDDITHIIRGRRIPPGFVELSHKTYVLRPEAIESVFMMYRLTGDPGWMDKAWTMFLNIEKHTRTDIASAALLDITSEKPTQQDKMPSFWLAETLKYFYLIFSEFDLVDLDKWIFNTEAHPLHRPDVV